MHKKMFSLKKSQMFALIISSLVVGCTTTVISAKADSGYTVIKRMTGNNTNVAYHLANNSKNTYL